MLNLFQYLSPRLLRASSDDLVAPANYRSPQQRSTVMLNLFQYLSPPFAATAVPSGCIRSIEVLNQVQDDGALLLADCAALQDGMSGRTI